MAPAEKQQKIKELSDLYRRIDYAMNVISSLNLGITDPDANRFRKQVYDFLDQTQKEMWAFRESLEKEQA